MLVLYYSCEFLTQTEIIQNNLNSFKQVTISQKRRLFAFNPLGGCVSCMSLRLNFCFEIDLMIEPHKNSLFFPYDTLYPKSIYSQDRYFESRERVSDQLCVCVEQTEREKSFFIKKKMRNAYIHCSHCTAALLYMQ